MTYTLLAGSRPTIDKDPDASLVYGIDVADVLADGDTISGTPTVSGSGVTPTMTCSRSPMSSACTRTSWFTPGGSLPVQSFTCCATSPSSRRLSTYDS